MKDVILKSSIITLIIFLTNTLTRNENSSLLLLLLVNLHLLLTYKPLNKPTPILFAPHIVTHITSKISIMLFPLSIGLVILEFPLVSESVGFFQFPVPLEIIVYKETFVHCQVRVYESSLSVC
jgi:hypothetical protein